MPKATVDADGFRYCPRCGFAFRHQPKLAGYTLATCRICHALLWRHELLDDSTEAARLAKAWHKRKGADDDAGR